MIVAEHGDCLLVVQWPCCTGELRIGPGSPRGLVGVVCCPVTDGGRQSRRAQRPWGPRSLRSGQCSFRGFEIPGASTSVASGALGHPASPPCGEPAISRRPRRRCVSALLGRDDIRVGVDGRALGARRGCLGAATGLGSPSPAGRLRKAPAFGVSARGEVPLVAKAGVLAGKQPLVAVIEPLLVHRGGVHRPAGGLVVGVF